jgi:MFS family permease
VFASGCAAFGIGVYPAFLGLHSGTLTVVIVVLVLLLGVVYGIQSGAESTLFAGLCPTRTRYTGMSLVFQGSGIYASGLTPLILTSLLAATGGSPWLACGFLVLTAIISVVATTFRRPVVDLWPRGTPRGPFRKETPCPCPTPGPAPTPSTRCGGARRWCSR